MEDLSIASETRSKNLKNSRSQKESLSRTICLPVDSTVVCKKMASPLSHLFSSLATRVNIVTNQITMVKGLFPCLLSQPMMVVKYTPDATQW